MPRYTFQDRYGRKVTLEGDTPPSEQDLDSVFSTLKPPKMMAETPKETINRFMSPHEFSPSAMLQKIPAIASKATGKLGEMVTEELGRQQVNPYVSAGVGTLISMGPDILMSGTNPMRGAPRSTSNMALAAERRALGIKAPMLRSDFARGQAAKAAEIGIKENILNVLGSPDKIFSKAKDLVARSGSELGKIRESVGNRSTEPILKAIDDYKSVRLQGATGGKWDAIARKIEEAKDTIKGVEIPGTGEASLKRVSDAKKEIKDAVNWMSDNVSQRDAKGLAMAIESGIKDVISKAGGNIKRYKQLKPIYSAAKTMIKGLNNELAAQEGNMAVSLPSLGAGASGGPLTALKIGAFELGKRRGAGIAAHELANLPSSVLTGTSALPVINAAINPMAKTDPVVSQGKVLTEIIARKFLRKAKRSNPNLEGDALKNLAREMAIKDGYEISE